MIPVAQTCKIPVFHREPSMRAIVTKLELKQGPFISGNFKKRRTLFMC